MPRSEWTTDEIWQSAIKHVVAGCEEHIKGWSENGHSQQAARGLIQFIKSMPTPQAKQEQVQRQTKGQTL